MDALYKGSNASAKHLADQGQPENQRMLQAHDLWDKAWFNKMIHLIKYWERDIYKFSVQYASKMTRLAPQNRSSISKHSTPPMHGPE